MGDMPESSSLLGLRNRDLSLFLPFILALTNDASSTANTDQETGENVAATGERIILINPFTQEMVVIEGGVREEEDGQPPASKASIEAMPRVEIGEGDDEGECVICLEEWKVGEEAREMPCKHKFHGECVVKWLGIHGSCPICRFKMPVDLGVGKKIDARRRRRRRDLWVSFSVRLRDEESTPNQTNDSS